MSQQTEEQPVLVAIDDGLATITLNRPGAYNALNLSLAEALLNAVIRCDEDAKVRAVIIIGSGSAFCSGGDIKQMMERLAADGHGGIFLKTLTVRLHAAIATMVRMQKPVITAVNGAAAGAGLSLALAGDLVLAADAARFTVAYTAIGLAPDGSSTYFLPRLIGPKRAFELMCTNRTLSAKEAQALGIVNEVYPAADFMARAREFAQGLANGPTVAIGWAKKLVALGADCSIETAMEHERQAIAVCGRSEDFREGASAFVGKRKATFNGR